MRFAAGDDVFYVGLAGAGEIGAGVRAVDAVALLGDNLGLDTLRVRIVARVVGRAAVFRRYRDALQAVSATAATAVPPLVGVGVGGVGVNVGGSGRTGMFSAVGITVGSTLMFRSGA